MDIKEMPVEEKYDRLLDSFLLEKAINYAFQKKMGMVSKHTDFYIEAQEKMVPSYLGTAFKMFKTLSAGKAFKQVVKQLMDIFQETQPLSDMELTWISDREVSIRTVNCGTLNRMKKLVKKAGLDINPKFMCGIDTTVLTKLTKKFGVNITIKREENGCVAILKLQ